MKKNIRFIKTKVSDDNVYLLLTKCDYCPYFCKDKYISKVRCGKSFNSPNGDNVITSNVRFMIMDNNLVVEDSDTIIPHWCTLSDKMKTEMDSKMIRYKSRGFIYEMLSFFIKGEDKIIPDMYVKHKYGSDELEYNEGGKLYLQNQVINQPIKSNTVSPVYSTPRTFQTYTPPIIKNICSCCGEDKEDVKRNINNGICSDCFIKNNNTLKYNSYINNFRLKRKSDWSKDNFKIINNLIEI